VRVRGAPCPLTLEKVVTKGKLPHSHSNVEGTWKRHRVLNTVTLAIGNPSLGAWVCRNAVDALRRRPTNRWTRAAGA
jgi:hypothetical protein